MEDPRPLVTLRRKTEGQWAPPPGCYESAKWASVGGDMFVSAPRVTPNLGILSVLQFLCFSQGGDTPCSA